MSEAGGKRGFKAYVGTLVATLLFPVLWMQALRMARRHADEDPRARAKVIVAIGASLLIGAGGFLVVSGFLAGAEAGMYRSLDARLALATGESEYLDAWSTMNTTSGAIPKIEANIPKAELELANATALNQSAPSRENADAVVKAQAKLDGLQETLKSTQEELRLATARKAELEGNHAQYQRISAATKGQDDGEVRRLVDGVPAYSEASGSKFPKSKDLDANVDAAFAKKAESMSEMTRFAWLFLWPSLAGAFFAPLAFAFGSILKATFAESDTVGFKPYPGAAAGFFLLLGAFGVPSLLFAAWTFNDALGRSEEGQIAL